MQGNVKYTGQKKETASNTGTKTTATTATTATTESTDPMDIDNETTETTTTTDTTTDVKVDLNAEDEVAASVPKGMLTSTSGNADSTKGAVVKGRAKSYQLPVLRAGGHDLYNKFVVGETNTAAWNAISEYYGYVEN